MPAGLEASSVVALALRSFPGVPSVAARYRLACAFEVSPEQAARSLASLHQFGDLAVVPSGI